MPSRSVSIPSARTGLRGAAAILVALLAGLAPDPLLRHGALAQGHDATSAHSARLELLLEIIRSEEPRSKEALERSAEEALQILADAPNPPVKADVRNRLSRHFSDQGRAQEALVRAEEAREVAASAQLESQRGWADYHRALALWYLSRPEEALRSGAAAVTRFEHLSDLASQATAHTLLGAIHRSRGNYSSALNEHFASLNLATSSGDADAIARANNNIALIHWNLEDHEKARQRFLLAARHYRAEGRARRLSATLSNLGLIEVELDRPEAAIPILEEALELHQQSAPLPRSKARILSNLAFAYEELGREELALQYNSQVLELREQLGDDKGRSRALGAMASIHLHRQEYDLAEARYREALGFAQLAKARQEQALILEGLARALKAQGDPAAAFAALQQGQEIQDEIDSQGARVTLAEIESQRELALKQIELERTSRRQTFMVWFSLFLVVVAVALLLNTRLRGELLRRVQSSNDELQLAQLRRKESDRRYRALFDDAVVPRLVFDAGTGSILEANAPAQRLGGISSSPVGESNIAELRPTWLRRALAKLGPASSGPRCVNEQWRTESGAERHAQVWLTPTVVSSRDCVLATVHDVTKDRRLEEDRIRIDQLGALGVLAGGIAHDFNNALMAIMGNISIAKLDVEPESETSQTLTQAEHAVQHAAEMTSSLLVFSKGGAPRRELQELGRQVEDTAKFSMAGSPATLQLEVDRGLWAEVDLGQFKQVISNLVLNAVQAVPDGGRLGVRAERLRATAALSPSAGPGPYIRITVSDTGPGVDPGIAAKVFDPYFTTKSGGSGLGLTSAFAIANRHGGWLECDMGTEIGASFTAFFPASDRVVEHPSVPSPRALPGSRWILVMDDEAPIRDFYRSALEALGHDVVAVDRGEEAVRAYGEGIASGTGFDCVILDLTVPGGMGGERVLRELLLLDPGVRAIVASGYSQDPVMSEHREAGFAAALSKPFGLESLTRTLSAVLDDPPRGEDPDEG